MGDEGTTEEVSHLGPVRRWLVVLIATGWALFQSYIAATIPLAPTPMRTIHMSFAFALTFTLLPTSRRFGRLRHVIDLVLAGVGVWSMVHLLIYFSNPEFQRLTIPHAIDIWLAWGALAVAIIAVWRATGPSLGITALLFLAYAFLGQHLPGPVGHAGFPVPRVLSFLYLRIEGMLGSAVGTSATTIFPVVLFGALLVSLGGGTFFTQLATSLMGHVRGGAGKIAVLASALFGTVSGTGPANVASTGVFTIPLMKRTGYQPAFAAAVEASASIGGQILPPIMGASAFVMADFLQVSYSTIIRHAIIPALLFYLMVMLAVHLEAVKQNLPSLDRAERPPLKPVLAAGWHFLPPLGLLIFVLGVFQRSVALGAFQATMLLLVLEFGRRLVQRRTLQAGRIINGIIAGAKGGLIVATATAAVQIVIATVGTTGIGLKLSSLLINLSGGRLLVLLILTMLASLLLGTGLPTVPTYLILAILTAPALADFGVPLIAAHFFVFYFGVMSDLTPPTALGPTVGAGIAGAPLMRTMVESMRLGLAGFILPFMFVYRPALILQGTATQIAVALVFAVIGVGLLAAGLTGYLRRRMVPWERAGFIAFALLLVFPHPIADAVGLLGAVALVALQLLWQPESRVEPRPAADGASD